MDLVKEYGLEFIIGGLIVAGIKFSSKRLPLKYAGIIGSLPVGLFSTIFTVSPQDSLGFIKNYSVQTFSTIFATIAYIIVYGLNIVIGLNAKTNLAYGAAVITWLVFTILKLMYIKV